MAADIPTTINPFNPGASTSNLTSLGSIRGPRLIYEVDMGGTVKVKVLLKEAIGKWLELSPLYPEYGKFSKGNNKDKEYTKRPGFRGRSWKFLLKPGTSIPMPDANWKKGATTTTNRSCVSFEIGFTRKITVRQAIQFAKKCKQSANIVGVQSDTGRIYRWSGPMNSTPSESSPKPIDPGSTLTNTPIGNLVNTAVGVATSGALNPIVGTIAGVASGTP